MNSFNHYSFGAVGQWLINRCLGIERKPHPLPPSPKGEGEAYGGEPGFQHFILRPEPDPTGKMTFARGHLDTRYGRIESSWQCHPDGTVTYRFAVPKGTSATLLLPDKSPIELKPGTYNY
jgi:alpha-L-rhamnosidase